MVCFSCTKQLIYPTERPPIEYKCHYCHRKYHYGYHFIYTQWNLQLCLFCMGSWSHVINVISQTNIVILQYTVILNLIEMEFWIRITKHVERILYKLFSLNCYNEWAHHWLSSERLIANLTLTSEHIMWENVKDTVLLNVIYSNQVFHSSVIFSIFNLDMFICILTWRSSYVVGIFT